MIFEVTPRINSSGSVILNIAQEVSLVGETDQATGNPVISQRLINSSVAVDSGETIVLGGLFSDRRTNGSGGIPILKDLPLAGSLFGSNSQGRDQTELLVLITPRIVNSTMDARRVTAQLRDRVEFLRRDDASLSTQVNIPSTRTTNSDLIANAGTVNQAVATAAQSAPTPVGAVPGGQFLAVLGSFSNAENAQRHWINISGQNANVLGQMTPTYRQSGSLVMVTVGPMSREAADGICRSVSTDCFVGRQ